jgi:FkbM family methyltransferase
MGYLRNKYTKEYFTGRSSKNGKLLGFGVEGYDSFMQGNIRPIDKSILSQVNFSSRNVLEFGFGRGEAIKYALEQGAKSYVGVDFAKAAVDIAKSFLKIHKIKGPLLYQSDALEFLRKYTKRKNYQKFDVILLLDVIEHIPRTELTKILIYIKKVQSERSVVVINTPAYKFDNDVLKNGLDNRNNIDSFDSSDLREETRGMHCNKYSKTSLQNYMHQSGFINISECHFYVNKNIINNKRNFSYLERWNYSYVIGCPIQEIYKIDQIDSPYLDPYEPKEYSFDNGHMSGLRLYTSNTYIKAAFPKGEHDKAMFEDLKKIKMSKGTIFDVGGFIGVSSLLFAKYTSQNVKIYSFEPNPYNIDRMYVNLSLNPKFSSRIEVFNIALGDDNKSTTMLLSSTIDNGYSSTSRLEHTYVEHSESHLKDLGFFKQQINVKTMDDFIAQHKIKPDIIKLDIEGAEHLFLFGSKLFLSKNSPILYIEIHSQYCAYQCINFLSKLGYIPSFLSEEEDGRILLKFMRNDLKKSTSVKSIQFDVNQNKLNELSMSNVKLLNENYKLESEYLNYKNNYIKLISNPLIKIEMSIYKRFKKIIDYLVNGKKISQ